VDRTTYFRRRGVDQGGNLKEVLARLHDFDAAKAAYDDRRTKYARKLLDLSQGGRIPAAVRPQGPNVTGQGSTAIVFRPQQAKRGSL